MNVAGSKKAQAELKDHRKFKEDQRARDLGWIMQHPEGRRFIFDLLDRRCLLFSASYTGNSETYLREGRRAVAIDITREVQKQYPNEYVLMITEAFSTMKRDALVEEGAARVAQGDDE